MAMDYEKIKAAVQAHEPAMTALLRRLISLPGDSGQEEARARCILAQMQLLGFDECVIDPMGNVIGVMGQGERLIAFDGHMDTVGPGLDAAWDFDPCQGDETDDTIGGRGASDQLGGLVSAIYGVKVMRELDLIPGGYRVMVTATVQEEACDGLCWQYLHDHSHISPEFVVLTEPTDGGIYRGHRGRMEIELTVRGTACHGSAPERGDNAIFKMADILQDIRALNDNPGNDETIPGLAGVLDPELNDLAADAQILGRGTITVSQIVSQAPARCAVADSCRVILDRRLTAGETDETALAQLRSLPAVARYGQDVTIETYTYETPSWTGLSYPGAVYCPAWLSDQDAPHVQALVQAHEAMFGPSRQGTGDALETRADLPLVDKWTFSTNGAAIAGRFCIPCVGFGPGTETLAHAPNEITWKQDMLVSAAVYAAVPMLYAKATGTALEAVKRAITPKFVKKLISRGKKEVKNNGNEEA